MDELTTNYFSDAEENNNANYAEMCSKFNEKLSLYGPITTKSWTTQINTMVELFKNDESRKETISEDIATIDYMLNSFCNFVKCKDDYLKSDTTFVEDLLSQLKLDSYEDLELIPVFIDSLKAFENHCYRPYYMYMQDLISFAGRVKFFIHMYLLTNNLIGPNKQVWQAALRIYRVRVMLSAFLDVFYLLGDEISYTKSAFIRKRTLEAAHAKEGLTGDSINYINSLFRRFGVGMYYSNIVYDWINNLRLRDDNALSVVTFMLNPYKHLIEFNGENGENEMWDIALIIYNSLFYNLPRFSKSETKEPELLKLKEALVMILRNAHQITMVLAEDSDKDTIFLNTFVDIARDLKLRVCDLEQILNLKELEVEYPVPQSREYIACQMLKSEEDLINVPEALNVYRAVYSEFINSYDRYCILCSRYSDEDEDRVKEKAEITAAFIEADTLQLLVYKLRGNEMSRYQRWAPGY